MPKTKKEELFFTLMMCTAMLAMMISYNQVMAAGSMKALTFGSWLHEAVIMGPVIVALEFSIIAPLAHKSRFGLFAITPMTAFPSPSSYRFAPSAASARQPAQPPCSLSVTSLRISERHGLRLFP